MHLMRLNIAIALAGLSFVASPVSAQLAPGSDGRLLDANNQVGSGGINRAAPQNLFNTANLYITGNTTRGTAFQGFSPVRNQFSLFTSLPSTALANFERDSVGLESISGSGAGFINPYFNRTQTVANAGAIIAGRNLIGSSAPANSYFAPPTSLQSPLTNGLGLNYSPGEYNINPAAADSAFPGTTPLTNNAGYANSLDMLRLKRETIDLQSSPLFPNSNDRFSLSGKPVYMNPYDDPYQDSTDSLLRDTTPLSRSLRSIDDPLRRPSSEEMLNASSELVSPTSVAPRLFQSSLTGQERDPLTGRVVPKESQYLAIRDEPSDLLQGSSLVQPTTLAQATNPSADDTQPVDSEELADDFDSYTPESIAAANNLLEVMQAEPADNEQPGDETEINEDVERAQSVLERATSESLKTLAGSSKTSSAELIAQAESKVQEGKYYQAARLYEMAARMAPDQAMPRLGHAHALFAAGEFMTAYRYLVEAIDMYPAFGYLNFDLTNFIPDANLIDIRRANLEERLKQKEDYRLRFLLGYVEYYIGLKQFGIPNLRRAAGEAPDNSIPARFPDIIEKPGKANKSDE
ncbi:MAG TPA: hypothetical protein PKN33_05715 [Phycisphaerae bacterium]|nr:hypothetical protein [Phycisphaerae bacterium]